MKQIDNSHWRFFLALEEELFNTQIFVEFHPNNEKTFSIKFRSIILQACSEIEKILKLICKIDLKERKEIDDIFDIFCVIENHREFLKIVVLMPLYRGEVEPWNDWKKGEAPKFWQDHNKIKHRGNIEVATLKNAIDSLAGLFALLLAWYYKEYGNVFSASECIILPKLFEYPGLSATHVIKANSHNIEIPGFDAN